MNALYPYFKQVCLDKGSADSVDMNSDALKVAAVDATATFQSTDKYLADLEAGCIIGRSSALTSPTVTNGTFDCDDPTVAAVPTGKTIAGYVVFKDTGSDASSTLIAWVDTDSAGDPISLPGNGSDVQIQMDAAGLFDL